MFVLEKIHSAKKRIVKYYKDYFTIEGTYTSLLPDRVYLRKLYKQRLGKELNLKNPQTFTEKINWLKLYDRRPEYTMMVDKYAVRDYVERIVGGGYLVPLLGVWSSVDEVPFDELPDQFVLKCNHDNGVIICKDKRDFDIEATKKTLTFHMNRDYYRKGREWPYKDVKRKIIAEKYMSDGSDSPLVDYKFFCFDGVVKACYVATDRPHDTRFDFFDRNFKHLPIINDHPNSSKIIRKPSNFDEMVHVAEKLARGIPHVRIDLYNINGKIYFGEMTFYHMGGFHPLEPVEWEKVFGAWIRLPAKWR